MQNADVILIMGRNPASNHPISFRWINKAMEKGAKLISVDPRFTNSSAKAHIYARLRSGTDIAFLGGMIKYILDNDLIQKEYVVEYTNASFLIDEKFGFQDGLFTGYDAKGRKYDRSTWKYQVDAKGIPKIGQDLAESPLRLPAPEEALLPLQPGDRFQTSPGPPRRTC